MSATRPLEAQLLAPARRILDQVARDRGEGARLDSLEAFAAQIGRWDLDTFRATVEVERALSTHQAVAAAERLVGPVASSGIHPALAITALARPNVTATEHIITYRRRRGVAWSGDLCISAVAAARGVEPGEVKAEVVDFQLSILQAERDELQRRIDELFEDLPGMFALASHQLRSDLPKYIAQG